MSTTLAKAGKVERKWYVIDQKNTIADWQLRGCACSAARSTPTPIRSRSLGPLKEVKEMATYKSKRHICTAPAAGRAPWPAYLFPSGTGSITR